MIGARLEHIRGSRTQAEMAELLGVHKNTYSRWEREEREIGAEALAALASQGWSMDWLFTGEGAEQRGNPQTASDSQSQAVRQEELTLALQLSQQALDGGTLDPPDHAQLVSLIYDALVHGLPSAQVIALARPAARGISNRGSRDATAVGGSGKGAAGKSKTA